MADASDLTLVIDIGKSRAKLLLLDDEGRLVEQHARVNASVASPLGYRALDLEGLAAWAAQTLKSSPHARACRRVIASTHGASLVALDERAGLAWAPLDYEFDALPAGSALAQAFDAAADPFAKTLSPPLPLGLECGAAVVLRAACASASLAADPLPDALSAVLGLAALWCGRQRGFFTGLPHPSVATG